MKQRARRLRQLEELWKEVQLVLDDSFTDAEFNDICSAIRKLVRQYV
ncbi:MAG TPA: hypothetical protein VGY13_10285 [Solirubrobacteraceae bacterium]|jgi:hypothetical protein|nr:hypothetical protein [Solirubrobacteraceae bacterium]